MATIAEILMAQGQAAAESRRAQGQIWGQALQRIGQIPQQIQTQGALNQDRIAQAKLRDLQTQEAQGQVAAQQQTVQDRGTLDSALSAGADLPTVEQRLTTAQQGHLIPLVRKQFADADEAAAKADKAKRDAQEAQADYFGSLAYNVAQHGYDPTAFSTAVALAYKHGAVDQQGAGQALAQAMQNPTGIKSLVDPIIAASPTWSKQVVAENKPVALPKDATLVRPLTGDVIARGAQGAPTAEEDKAKYIGLQQKVNLGQTLTPNEKAWADSYAKAQTLGIDATAGAAANRQATAITAQTDQQRRAQDFAELQAGRADLEKNVTTPYLTAQTSANTLRDVIDAAKGGNKVAASLQPLEATMSAIRAQGLNRINTAEIGVAGSAGSLFDRISGWIGKADAGQPVPADIQNDMIQFADILEKAAYKKYRAGFDSTTTLYPTLKGRLQPLPEPGGGQGGDPRAQKAAQLLQGEGLASDATAVATFLKKNPQFR